VTAADGASMPAMWHRQIAVVRSRFAPDPGKRAAPWVCKGGLEVDWHFGQPACGAAATLGRVCPFQRDSSRGYNLGREAMRERG
jgi:hypothetical protein